MIFFHCTFSYQHNHMISIFIFIQAPAREDVVAFMELFKKLVLALIELGHLNMKLDQTGIFLFISYIILYAIARFLLILLHNNKRHVL